MRFLLRGSFTVEQEGMGFRKRVVLKEGWSLLGGGEGEEVHSQSNRKEKVSEKAVLKEEGTNVTGCRARSTSLWVHRNIFWQLSRDGSLNGSGTSHAMTVSP